MERWQELEIGNIATVTMMAEALISGKESEIYVRTISDL